MARIVPFFGIALGLALGLFPCAQDACAQANLPLAFAKKVPESLRDLQDIEKHVQGIFDRVLPATVCLRIGPAQGSGVIINREGYILTAAHVSGPAGRDAVIILPDGRKLTGKTLGANNEIDSGLVVITEKTDFPYVQKARSSDVVKGNWCLALGHPGGYKPGRPPVLRLGRVLEANDKVIVTDCTLVGGDSGGPLFDMNGRVIGIHSRIGGKISANMHVPVDTYQSTWSRLAAGDVWGTPLVPFQFNKSGEPYLGMKAKLEKSAVMVNAVTPGSPAERAGLRTHDVILKFDNQKVGSVEHLGSLVRSRQPGAQVMIDLRRNEETLAILVVLGARPK